MSNLIIISLITSGIYLLIKFINIKFMLKSDIILKDILRETILVCLSSIIANILIDKLNINKFFGNEKESPGVFTSNPDF